MSWHRFQELLTSRLPSAPFCVSAFVPCLMVLPLAPVQLTQVAAIYQIAAERTRRQLRPARPRLPAFSAN